MSLFSLLLGGRNDRRRQDLRVRLNLNGIERLEDRIQPSLGSLVQGVLHQVGGLLNPNPGGGGTTANASISGSAFIDWNGNRTQDSQDNADSGITVTLTGTDDQGHAVSLTTSTDANGQYSFTALRAGTYSVTFSSSTESGNATVGSAGGSQNSSSSNEIDGITLTSSTQASGYNFAVTPQAS